MAGYSTTLNAAVFQYFLLFISDTVIALGMYKKTLHFYPNNKMLSFHVVYEGSDIAEIKNKHFFAMIDTFIHVTSMDCNCNIHCMG